MTDGLGIDQAIWIGHDWGGPVVWSIASHHPERCLGVASLCVPYRHLERGLDAVIELVDRAIYPKDTFPAGQWDYQLYYQAHFESATVTFDANPETAIKALFRKGDPSAIGQPAAMATIQAAGGWFGGLPEAPDLPLDEDVLSEQDLALYVAGLVKNGFFGPDAYYMNHAANARYAAEALHQGRLEMPVLFLAAGYDGVCETVTSGAAEPMRAICLDLQEVIIDSGHWMAQEAPVAVNRALVNWLGDHSWL